MRLVVLLLYAAWLGGGWQPAPADEDTLRALGIDEFHRSLSAATIAGLDGAPPVAARAALAIGRAKRPDGVAPLRAHLAATDASVRAMVVYALGLLADETSLADVRSLVRSDPNSAVRYAAADALGRIAATHADIATPALADDLLRAASQDPDAVVRAHAAVQLDAFKASPDAARVAAVLERIEARDRAADVRWHAAWMLFRGYAKFADLDFLTRQVHDRDELVRIETVRALGRRKELGAIAVVRPLLDDPSWRVQLEAGEALRRLMIEPPTQHLKAFPPGLHLPRLTNSGRGAFEVPPEVAMLSPAPTAPDPRTFALGPPPLPRTASDMNGPLPGRHQRVLLRTTAGDVVVRLYPEWAPATVANFLNLVDVGYFNNNRWFRIVPDFVVQTGDPSNTGDGDAGYTIPAEENPVEQRAGIIAMGLNYDQNGAVRDSAGTQFYLTLSPQLHLDRAFSVFGEVETGFDVLANLLENATIETATRLPDD